VIVTVAGFVSLGAGDADELLGAGDELLGVADALVDDAAATVEDDDDAQPAASGTTSAPTMSAREMDSMARPPSRTDDDEWRPAPPGALMDRT
jgi:hypothetical protein